MEAEERNNHVCVNYGFNAIRIVFIYPGILPFLWWSFVLLQSSIKC